MITMYRAAAHFAGLTTMQDFATLAEAEAWVAERRRCGCTARLMGIVERERA